MKSGSPLRIALVALVASLAMPAWARPDSVRLGVGAESMLGFWGPNVAMTGHPVEEQALPGVSVTIPAAELFDLQAIIGTRLGAGAGSTSVLDMVLGVRGIYRGLPLTNNVDLGVFFGGGYEIRSVSDWDVGVPEIGRDHCFHLETGVRPEWFPFSWLSIHTQVGLSVGLLLGQSSIDPAFDPGVSMAMFGVSTILAKAGFTLWF